MASVTLVLICIILHITAALRFPNSLKDIDLAHAPSPTLFEKIMSRLVCHPSSQLTPVQPSRSGSRVLNGLKKFQVMSLFGGDISSKKRMLILMSDTGGGHRASAQALDQAIQERYPGKVNVTIMDIWTDHGSGLFRKLVPMYRQLAKRPLLWRAFYSYGTFPPTRMLTELDSKIQCYRKFKKAIETVDPDLVVSVHPLCQLMPISIVKELNQKRPEGKVRIPFVTVVTDLGSAHCTWFDRRADAVYVPSDAVRAVALHNHIPAERILMKGLPIRPSFWRAPSSKNALRQALGIPLDCKSVLLMGGGDGVGGLSTIAKEVANKLKTLDFKTHLTIICGQNIKSREDLTRALVPSPNTKSIKSSWFPFYRLIDSIHKSVSESNSPTISTGLVRLAPNWGKLGVTVRGFVNNIDEYMAASDLLVTKAGPGTIAEAMTRGLPIVLSSFLPGQEAGNVPYVTEGKFGVYTSCPKKIAQEVGALLGNSSRLTDMGRRAKELSRPQATREIANELAEYLLAP